MSATRSDKGDLGVVASSSRVVRPRNHHDVLFTFVYSTVPLSSASRNPVVQS